MAPKLKARPSVAKDLPPLPLWKQVDLDQLLRLVKDFYSGDLTKSDNKLPIQRDKAIPMPHVEPTTRPLALDVTWDQMNRVMRHLRGIRVQVGGMGVNGWHEYVIGVHLGIFKPYLKKYEMMPKVRDAHKQEAIDVLGRAFQRLVLNGEAE